MQLLQMCSSLSLFTSSSQFTCLSVSLSLHLALSLHMSVSISLLTLSLFSMHCVLLWWWLWMWLWMLLCVSSCLALKNASVCTSKTLPCVLSKRPCNVGHGRFEGSHGSVSKVVAPSLPFSLPPSLLLSPSPLMCLFLSLCSSLFLSFSSLSSSDPNNHDNDRSSGWLSLLTRPYRA